MECGWSATFSTIHRRHDKIFQLIDAARRLDVEQDQPKSAIESYKLAIVDIDEVLAVPVQLPYDVGAVQFDATWHETCRTIHKLKRARTNLVQRIGQLLLKHPTELSSAASTSNVIVELNRKIPRTYTELAIALANMEADVNVLDSNISSQMQLIYACDPVRMYLISPNGDVTVTKTNADNCVLEILSLTATPSVDPTKQHYLQQNTYFLRVNFVSTIEQDAAAAVHFQQPWIYPLVAGTSPCFHTEFGAFIVPDLYADEPNSAVGLVVPPTFEPLLLEILEAILHGVVLQLSAADRERKRQSTIEMISDKMIRCATFVAQGLVLGSTKIGQLMTSGTPHLLSAIRKRQDVLPVSDGAVSSCEVATKATTVILELTAIMVEQLGYATIALGRYLAPHVQTQGSKLLSCTTGLSREKATEKVTAMDANIFIFLNLISLYVFKLVMFIRK